MRWDSSAGCESGKVIGPGTGRKFVNAPDRKSWSSPVKSGPVREVVLMVFADTVAEEANPSALLRSKLTASALPIRS